MKRGWAIILSIVGIALGLAALCIIVGFITGADTVRIYAVIERLFELNYNINLDELINTWLPHVIEILKTSL